MVHCVSLLFALAAGQTLIHGAQAQLNTAAKAAGLKYFGSATDNPELSDTAYVAELSNTADFGQITPGNSQKWDATEPSQNTFSYTNGDTVVSLGQKNGQLLRCHNLVWYSQLPSWVTNGQWTNATLQAAMKNHITNLVTHYKGKCYAWDVVNEALNDDGTFRTNVFYNTIGPAYIPIAFATAAAIDPTVKLYYNDYNIENPGAKSTAAQNIVKMIKAYGVKIDGVGLQGHFIVGSTPSLADQKSNLAAFTALGVEVAYTELDIRMTLPETAALDKQQSTDYQNTVTACVSTKNCIGITIWDYTDKYSWVPNTFSGQGAACPFDSNLQKKPAYYGILAGLGASSGSSSTLVTSAAPTTSQAASSAAPATSAAPTSSAAAGTVAHWGQCGGQGWTGATTCVSPYTCKASNQYYSQCL